MVIQLRHGIHVGRVVQPFQRCHQELVVPPSGCSQAGFKRGLVPELEEEDAQLEEGGFGVDGARAGGGWTAGFESEGDEGLVEVGASWEGEASPLVAACGRYENLDIPRASVEGLPVPGSRKPITPSEPGTVGSCDDGTRYYGTNADGAGTRSAGNSRPAIAPLAVTTTEETVQTITAPTPAVVPPPAAPSANVAHPRDSTKPTRTGLTGNTTLPFTTDKTQALQPKRERTLGSEETPPPLAVSRVKAATSKDGCHPEDPPGGPPGGGGPPPPSSGGYGHPYMQDTPEF
ncbi:hypothetical protein MAPG_11327 [Magnaporthiopsis poae ATCC 64411]|uniref:Uncharacterized protein n=1 Tax=Magnaporthiopsis poae (strain ATCC 64411 / 73-15) TaxID=644358 RepID=A0A0C4EEZ5_MAGP6|nr:hypothetical protein MAPG_11327 [Magnaporthiopsis poae ATCC 64411]